MVILISVTGASDALPMRLRQPPSRFRTANQGELELITAACGFRSQPLDLDLLIALKCSAPAQPRQESAGARRR